MRLMSSLLLLSTLFVPLSFAEDKTVDSSDSEQVNVEELELAMARLLGHETSKLDSSDVVYFAWASVEAGTEASQALEDGDLQEMQRNLITYVTRVHNNTAIDMGELSFPTTTAELNSERVFVANYQLSLLGEDLLDGVDAQSAVLGWVEVLEDISEAKSHPYDWCHGNVLLDNRPSERYDVCCDDNCTETKVCQTITSVCAIEDENGRWSEITTFTHQRCGECNVPADDEEFQIESVL